MLYDLNDKVAYFGKGYTDSGIPRLEEDKKAQG
jgi:hypothetical protein